MGIINVQMNLDGAAFATMLMVIVNQTFKLTNLNPFSNCHRQQTIPSFFHTKKTCLTNPINPYRYRHKQS